MKIKMMLVLVKVLGLLFFYVTAVSQLNVTSASFQVPQEYTKDELTRRFMKILDKELSGDNVCITLQALRELEELTRNSAETVFHDRAFNRVPEAERNLGLFLMDVRRRAKEDQSARITSEVIRNTFKAWRSPRGTICPLYPICK